MALEENVKVKIDADTRAWLEAEAERDGRNVSSVIRMAIRAYRASREEAAVTR